jgi:hypothetical protein
MEKLHILWAGITLAVVSPLLMGADGCLFVVDHEYINASVVPGHIDVDVDITTKPTLTCNSDPYQISTAWDVVHGLKWWQSVDIMPTVIWGTLPYGPATYRLPGCGEGWHIWGRCLPSQFEIHQGEYSGPLKAIWYTTQGTIREPAAACADGSYAHCNVIAVRPSTNGRGTPAIGAVEVTSGWYVPATGEQCVTLWQNVPVRCFETGTGQPIEQCYLPTAVDERFGF